MQNVAKFTKMARETDRDPRMVTISINDVCPLRCRHCSVGYSEDNHGSSRKMPADGLREAILGIDSGIYDIVSFVGGEPTLAIDLLVEGEAACREAGLLPLVTTAPVWAKSEQTAARFFSRLPKGFLINLSYDEYHLEFLSVDHYLNAVRASRSHGSLVLITISFAHDDEKTRLLVKLAPVLPLVTQVTCQRVVPIGNAAHGSLQEQHQRVSIRGPDDITRLPRTCHAGDPFITMTSEVHACCYSSTLSRQSPLHFDTGVGVGDSLAQMELDDTFRSLAENGLIDSLTSEARESLSQRFHGQAFANECELCIELLAVKERSRWDRWVKRSTHQVPCD